MNTYAFFADMVVVVHLAYVLFVVLGLCAIFLGGLLGWRWVRNTWFRLTHGGMISVVVIESLLSITCPLTTLEIFLRNLGGQSVRGGSFVGRLAHDFLFFDFTPEFFTIAYCLFGALVLLSWVLVPPTRLGRQSLNANPKE